MDRLEHRRVGAFGIDVARGRQADAARHCAGFVGENVTEKVVGYKHVESSGIGEQEYRGGVHVEIVDRDIGVFGAHFLDDPSPQASRIDKDVVFVNVCQLFART